MDQTLFTLPILTGKTEAARAFLLELESERKGQFAASQERLRLYKEVWAVQQLPQGDFFVVYFRGDDISQAFQQFAASQDEFDVWFKQQVQETTGADLNTPPPGPMSEILSDYEA
jgi:hypothetical protein